MKEDMWGVQREKADEAEERQLRASIHPAPVCNIHTLPNLAGVFPPMRDSLARVASTSVHGPFRGSFRQI